MLTAQLDDLCDALLGKPRAGPPAPVRSQRLETLTASRRYWIACSCWLPALEKLERTSLDVIEAELYVTRVPSSALDLRSQLRDANRMVRQHADAIDDFRRSRGGAALHAADLLTDLKSGHVLGANPRKQLIAQLWGVLAGTVVAAPAYLLLIKPEEIGTDKWPAPAAQVWAGIARALNQGMSALPHGAETGMLIGGAAGVVLALIEHLVPTRLKKYTLSPTAVGIAFVIPAWNSISMFVGAFLAWLVVRLDQQRAERYSLALAAGFIAGESLITVLVAGLVAFNVLGG